jgi:hypothetical protein
MEDKTLLVKTRQYVRQRVTKIYNTVNNDFPTIDDSKRVILIERLKSLRGELKDLDRRVFACLLSSGAEESELQQKLDEDESYEDKIYIRLCKLQENTNLSPTSGVPNHSVPQVLQQQRLQLPEVALLTYSNRKEKNLEKFFYNFESIVGRHLLSDYEKFLYIKNQLSGAHSLS